MSADVPPGYAIRPAREHEYPRLAEIEADAAAIFEGTPYAAAVAGDATSPAWFRRCVRAGGVVLVAEHDASHEPAGFVLLRPLSGGAHLDEVDVAPAHQRRGLGAALVRAALAWAREAGHPRVTLTTYRDVAWNAPFYARLGFRPLAPETLPPELAALRAGEHAEGLRAQDRHLMACEISDD